MIRKIDIEGSDFVGLYTRATDDIAVFSNNLDKEIADSISEFLQIRPVRADLNGITMAGALVAANSNGVVMPRDTFLDSKDLDHRNIVFLKDKINAMGNNIVANDRGAIIHKGFSKSSLKKIQDALGVEVVKDEIGGIKTVGSVSVLTKKGMIVTPTATEDELKFLSEFFKVPALQATANFGSIYVGSAMIANSKGVMTGTTTTTIEIGRIDEALS
ncbi:MAG: translation initiation factor IF-6 [Candidatus Thermoplasmatota archaeon]|nr:translation initiation factor IF-6 [Candidatus Thermoplasmatota archaeon]MCL5731608.1 translation initiation factor IF-6 [Candidatus Thermoplasmatota archaeon]